MTFSDDTTLGEIRRFLKTQDDTHCPACTQRVATIRRKLPKAEFRALRELYRLTEIAGYNLWVHKNDLPTSRGGDFAKLRHWGLIEAQPNDDDPTKTHSGVWRLTRDGCNFMNGTHRVPVAIFMRLNVRVGIADNTQVNFEEAWIVVGDFDVREL